MSTLVELVAKNRRRPFVVCDVSPPRSGNTEALSALSSVTPDMFFVAANPGRTVRASSPSIAQWIESNIKTPALFTMVTRDMNKTAMQTTLLGAHIMGLRNLVVVKGDNFNNSGCGTDKPVEGFTPTAFIRSVRKMNNRIDFTGRSLIDPTQFCVGATLDISRKWCSEMSLADNKIRSGSDFLIAQPNFDPDAAHKFLQEYQERRMSEMPIPIIWGIQIMSKGSISFANVPDHINKELDLGNSGYEIALEMIHRYLEIGINYFYLVPPIFQGGRRDYESAQAVIEDL